MKELGIDIETYSSNDLSECGVYKYVETPDFAILLFAYSVDGGEVRCVDMACGETLPPDIMAALTDPAVVKTAFNATFERICIGAWLGVDGRLDPAQWKCTMVRAARLGLPLSLAQCGEALRLYNKNEDVLYDERVISCQRKMPQLEVSVANLPFIESGTTQRMLVKLFAEGHEVTEYGFYYVSATTKKADGDTGTMTLMGGLLNDSTSQAEKGFVFRLDATAEGTVTFTPKMRESLSIT